MSETRSALIIANSRFEHPGLNQLQAPTQDADALARVLADPAIGGFEVRTLVNEPSHKVSLEIESFFDNRKRGDLLLLYFTGHGIKNDDDGRLYLATVDTQMVEHNVRRATAVSSSFINEVMSQSHSRRQILLLDCCYSGAFKEGMKAKGDDRAGAKEQFQGQGRVVLTASDALQFSFEGEQVRGEGVRSVFTSALVHGLESGKADLDRDGLYTLDEVYDYVYASITEQQPGQKPTKIGFVEGKIFIGTNPHPTIAPLPEELRESLEDRRQWVRLGAVHELERFLAGDNKGLSRAAQAALAFRAEHDDSYEVRKAAQTALAGVGEETSKPGQQEEPAREEREEKDRRAAQAEEAERAAKANADRLAHETRAYEAARQRDSAEGWQAFLAEFPESLHTNEILSRISSLATAAEAGPVSGKRRGWADFIDTMLMLIAAAGFQDSGGAGMTVAVIVCAFLVGILLTNAGKTPGHLVTNTQIVDERGNRLSYGRSLLYLAAWFPIGTFLLGLTTGLTVRYTHRHVALYDLLARTRVTRNTR